MNERTGIIVVTLACLAVGGLMFKGSGGGWAQPEVVQNVEAREPLSAIPKRRDLRRGDRIGSGDLDSGTEILAPIETSLNLLEIPSAGNSTRFDP